MLMIPYMTPGRNLPLSLWTPFDPTKTATVYHLMYAYEVLCTWTATAYDISTDIFIFVVFVVFNFVIASLGERIEAIGTRNDSDQWRTGQDLMKKSIYGDLIDFIKVHYEFDR